MKPSRSNQNLLNYLRMYKPLAAKVALGNLCALLQSLALVPVPWIIGRAIDTRLPQHDQAGLERDGLIIVALFAAWLGLSLASRWINLSSTKKVIARLRADVVEKLQRMAISFFDREDLGRLHASVILNTERIDVMSNFLLTGLAVSGLTAAFTLALMAHLDWKLTLMVLAMVPLVAAVNGALKGRVQERQQAWKDYYEGYSSRVQGLLESMRLVRAYGNEAYEQRRAEAAADGLSEHGVRWITMVGLYQGLMELLMGLAQALVLVVGGWQVLAGAMSPGDLVAYLGLLGLLFTPVRNIVNSMDQYFMGRSALDSVWAILDHDETEPARPGGQQRPIAGRLQVRGVSFAYAGGAQALSDVSFTVEPGQTVALVGRSGGGKSTLASLLIGFYRPQAGEILLDGLPLEAHASASLRRQTAVVPQAGLVLSGTVRENIRYGALDADDAAVWQAARLAQAEDFIRELPQGLDAQVGDLGVRLSGGQRQRIAIARALLRDPRLLILDEATSALDAVSEQAVAQALRNLKQGRTTLVIAHRLSTVVGADLILVLEKGRVAQQGTHAQLMAQGGIYRELAQGQLVQDAA